MKKDRFNEKLTKLEILGRHIEKYGIICIIGMILTLIACIALVVYWHIDPVSDSVYIDNFYLALYYFAIVMDSVTLVILILNRLKKISSFKIAIYLHIYTFLLFGWATLLALLDLKIGTSPMIVLNVTLVIAGLLVIEPIYFTILALLSMIIILILNGVNGYTFFALREELPDFIAYFVLIIIVAYRHYRITITEYKSKARLEQLTYYDDLTGLLNERSYMLTVDEINNELSKNNNFDFGIVVMDVNNLKATNDEYGHRYGCHLIVKTGHMLPETFKNSRCFHVGGDEFIVILLGDDLKNYKKIIEEFDSLFRFSHIDYEGKDLIFSVARGVSIHKDGQEYKDTFNIADKAMYENKVEIKTTYNLKSR